MTLTKEFINNPVEFMSKYALDPHDYKFPSVESIIGTRIFSKDLVKHLFDTSSQDQTQSGIFSYDSKPCIKKFKITTKNSIGGKILTLKEARYDDERVHMYYLPWKSMGVTNMTLPRHTDVRYFITAALSGCSIFVRGNATNPTIYHAGCEATGKFDSTEFWRACMRTISGGNIDNNMGEINKYSYLKSRDGGLTTDSAGFETQLKQLYRGTNKVKVHTSLGCVFGVKDKDSNLWSFYLQERSLYEVFDLLLGVSRRGFSPVSVRQFFPIGTQQVNMVTRYQKVNL